MMKISKVLKILMINAIICSLIQNPFVSEAMAAEKRSTSGFEAKDIINLANGALNLYGGYLGQKQQMLQQQIAAAANQKLMAQLSPSCRKPDGTACYTTPGKYFPECTLPASISNMPQNACGNPTPEVNQISAMITYEAISNGWINYYDQMSNKASNSTYAVGLRCLEDKQKALDSQIIEMSNSLQRLQDRLNQDKQVFRDNNKKLLEDMNTANDELFGMGDKSKNNLKMKTLDFAKYFSQSCQSVIGKDTLKGGGSTGLSGILQGLSSSNKAAADFNLNKNAIEDDVRRESEKISAAIKAGGIDDWLSNSKTQGDIKSASYPTIETTVKKQAAELNTARARINKELSALGYTPPAMDKNFTADMDDFMAHSTEFFKKKYVNDCVTGADKGIAIPVEDILKSLEQRRTKSAGTATSDYRIALKKILDSDAMMDQKMAMIKELEPQFPGITITYKDASQARVTESPYDLFMKTINKCEQQYVQDEKFSSKGSNGVSYQKKVERGRAALQELKNLNDSFASKVTHSIAEQILNCNGQVSKSGNNCSEESLKTTSDNFCVSHAAQCSNEIQGCYAEANNHIQVRKTKMENLAKTFNANVAAMVERSNALYEQQKIAVTNITKLIQSKFPGTNFELPKDMFVSMPELKKDAYGVEMAGDGDLKSFLDGESSMPAKIDKLKEMFKKQREQVNEEVSNYIALQENAMKEQKGRWEKLAGECKSAVDASSKALAQMNNENQKKQAEEDANVAKFCKKYNSISQNPVGGCGKAKDLAELSDSIAARLASQASTLTEQYASACDGFNNESDSSKNQCSTVEDGKTKYYPCASGKSNAPGEAQAKKRPSMPLANLCGAGSTLKNDKEFLANVNKKLTAADQEKLKEAKTMDEILEKADSLENNSFFLDLSELLSSNKDICTQLKKISSASAGDGGAAEKSHAAKREALEATIKTGKPEQVTVAQADLIKLLQDAPEKGPSAEKKKRLQDALSSLASISAPLDPNSKEAQAEFISKIGEQMEGPCDMQSNSNVTKNTGFDLKSFDASVLGSAR